MQDKVLQVAVLLAQYARGSIDRRGVLGCIQATGYSEQTAIFILDILEQPNNVTEALDEILAPDPLPNPIAEDRECWLCPYRGALHDHPSPDGGNPNDKT